MMQHQQVAEIISGHLRSLRRALRTPTAPETAESFRAASKSFAGRSLTPRLWLSF